MEIKPRDKVTDQAHSCTYNNTIYYISEYFNFDIKYHTTSVNSPDLLTLSLLRLHHITPSQILTILHIVNHVTFRIGAIIIVIRRSRISCSGRTPTLRVFTSVEILVRQIHELTV